MKKTARKTAAAKSGAAKKALTGMAGSAKSESTGSRELKSKAGRLEVTDLRADTFTVTRKKRAQTAAPKTKTVQPQYPAPKAAGKGAVKKASSAQKPETSAKKRETPAIKGPLKKYLKAGHSCKVTFRLPKEAAPDAGVVTIVGDFNDWNKTETQMQKLKNGDFTKTIELACNREYRFRYLIDSQIWENDWSADKYVRNRYGSDDSVVVIEANGVK
jgi:hypothetical protein